MAIQAARDLGWWCISKARMYTLRQYTCCSIICACGDNACTASVALVLRGLLRSFPWRLFAEANVAESTLAIDIARPVVPKTALLMLLVLIVRPNPMLWLDTERSSTRLTGERAPL